MEHNGYWEHTKLPLQDMVNLQPVQQTDAYAASTDMQQDNNPQVHTIMLNGQPALFIPASSSNMICQMLMGSSNPNQLYDIIQSSNQQLQWNQTDLANLMAITNQQSNEPNPFNLGIEQVCQIIQAIWRIERIFLFFLCFT
jgi:hypothetical protein